MLKKYCGLNNKKSIKAAVEHAVYMGEDYVWDMDINHAFPAIIIQGEMRKSIISQKTDKKIISIGTYIQYTDSYYSFDEFVEIKKRIGKTLLIFPMHSTHHVNLEYNIFDFINEIENIAKDYDTVMVCMYWKDILMNTYKQYQNKGFEIVSAGHIFDKNFLVRLKSIIELSDMVVANDVGSFIGQSIALHRPVYLFKQNYTFRSTSKKEYEEEYDIRLKYDIYLKNFEIFSSPLAMITDEQRAFANWLWGVDIKLTKQQMKSLFENLDNESVKNKIIHK